MTNPKTVHHAKKITLDYNDIRKNDNKHMTQLHTSLNVNLYDRNVFYESRALFLLYVRFVRQV